jgi:hypothetical protein
MEIPVVNWWNLTDILKEMDLNPILCKLLYHYLRREKSKAIGLFTNQIHYALFKQLANVPAAIYVSQNYVVLQFYTYERSHFYVIGINTDDKLFVNKIRNFNSLGAKFICEYHHKDGEGGECVIPIYLVSDQNIYQSMGFDYDVERSSDKTIPKYYNERMMSLYRIQGDLVLRIFDESVFFETVRQLIAEQVEQILTRVILQRIQMILSDLGISSQITTRFRRECVMFRAFPREKSSSEIRYYLENLVTILSRKLYIRDIAESIKFIIAFDSDAIGYDIAVNIFEGRAEFGQRFEPTVIRVSISREIINKFVDKIISGITLDQQDNIISRGRHLIRYYGYPSQFTILAKLPNSAGGEEEYIIPINMNVLHVVKGKMYLYHPEHKAAEINIMQNIAAEITNVQLDDGFEERMNYIAIKSLPDSRQLSLL